MKKLFVYGLASLLLLSCGCASLRRKFIRKRKKPKQQEEMVIAPQDYSKQQLSVDIAYMNYYNYWKSWHTELLQFLHMGANAKKIRSCFEQIILNLERMKGLLNEKKASQLDTHITKVLLLQADFEHKVVMRASFERLRHKADMLLSDINRNFASGKVKDHLVWK